VFNGDAFAAFVPARLENQLAALALHAGAKSVRFGAAAIIRLKGSLWHSGCSFENFDCSIAWRSPSILAFAHATFEC
jgi:hypothetical protein